MIEWAVAIGTWAVAAAMLLAGDRIPTRGILPFGT